MAKYFGRIGYAEQVETVPGVWEEKIVERKYYGDVVRNIRRLESSGNLNDNINASMEISIVADPYAIQNFHAMRYIEFMGSLWKIPNIEVNYPRLILTIGGVYNGEQAKSAD